MDLYLVRHAVAYDRDPQRWPDDGLRPLTREGVRRFRRAIHGIDRVLTRPDVVLASPYLRAADTAAMLRRNAHWPRPVETSALTRGDFSEWRTAITEAAEAGASRIALIGHEPYLSAFASVLLSGRHASTIELRKGGVIWITAPQGLALGQQPLLRAVLTPRILRALARG